MAVVACSAEELLAAAPLALGLEALDGVAPTLAYVADEDHPWAASIAAWYAAQARAVPVGRWSAFETDAFETRLVENETFDRVVFVGTAFPGALPEIDGALFALVGAGVHAETLDATRARLMELAAVGAIRSVELLARFGPPGREFIELVEEVHHDSGPDGQSRVADTLRAALFGRSGRVPVNLASRADPPALDPLTLLAFFVDASEVA